MIRPVARHVSGVGRGLVPGARTNYHKALLKNGVLYLDSRKELKRGLPYEFPSNSDCDSATSIAIARGIFDRIRLDVGAVCPVAGVSPGIEFQNVIITFLEEAFAISDSLSQQDCDLGRCSSVNLRVYRNRHLYEAAEGDADVAALLGSGYVIAPDVLVVREPEPDEVINADTVLVDDAVALRSGIRQRNNQLPLLHASISCKWTLRSNRAQNARSEALNLIRDRKGRSPHIAVVTGEPLPSRLSSLALGTGDIDCVYHFALPELISTLEELGVEDTMHLVNIMVEGKRLKDIADLPLDLAV